MKAEILLIGQRSAAIITVWAVLWLAIPAPGRAQQPTSGPEILNGNMNSVQCDDLNHLLVTSSAAMQGSDGILAQYQPGIDSEGRPVVPAEGPKHPITSAFSPPDILSFDILIDPLAYTAVGRNLGRTVPIRSSPSTRTPDELQWLVERRDAQLSELLDQEQRLARQWTDVRLNIDTIQTDIKTWTEQRELLTATRQTYEDEVETQKEQYRNQFPNNPSREQQQKLNQGLLSIEANILLGSGYLSLQRTVNRLEQQIKAAELALASAKKRATDQQELANELEEIRASVRARRKQLNLDSTQNAAFETSAPAYPALMVPSVNVVFDQESGLVFINGVATNEDLAHAVARGCSDAQINQGHAQKPIRITP